MSCDQFREALSARVDAEASPTPDDAVDLHLAECAECRGWLADIQRMRRWMVVRTATPVPDLTARIVAAAPPIRRRRWDVLRAALAAVGLCQVGLAIAQLLGLAEGMDGMAGGAMVTHLTNEGAAWNLAVGVGLCWAALRTAAAAAQLPLFTGFVVVLGALSAADLLHGQATVDRVLSHSLVVVGLVLLYAVARRHRARRRPTPLLANADGEPTAPVADAFATARPDDEPRRGYRDRPAGRHRAA